MKYIATFVVLLFSINFLYPSNIYDKKYNIILDTDANNELDDQHAIAYMLFNQKFFNILGITVNETFWGNKLKYHVLEAQRIVDLCGYNNKIRVIPGASKNYESIKNKITRKKFDGHKAVNFIIENANQVENEKLIIVAIGKLTNVALALKKDPEIAKKISKNIRDQIKKINVSINGETLRVSSKSKNDLQLAIKLVSELEESLNIPLKANNFR